MAVQVRSAFEAILEQKKEERAVRLDTELSAVDTFVLAKQTISRTDLRARFQARVDAAEKVKSDRAVLQTSVAEERAVDADVKPLRASMKQYLQARYGESSPEMQSFGFAPSRKGKASVAVKANAVLKAKATREARGTKGVQQKKDIKGTLPAPTTAPATPATPPAATPVAGATHA